MQPPSRRGAEDALEGGRRRGGEAADAVEPVRAQGAGRRGADPVQGGDRSAVEEGGGLLRAHLADLPRLPGLCGHPGEQRGGGDPDGAVGAVQGERPQPYELRQFGRVPPEVPQRAPYIGERGVGRERLDDGGDVGEQRQERLVTFGGGGPEAVEVDVEHVRPVPGPRPVAGHPALPELECHSLRSALGELACSPAGRRSAQGCIS
ncbi:hypothetical protein STAL104432_23275 [Streptomyces albus]